MAELELTCNGRVHAGWESMRISRSMEHCANSFQLAVSELWPGQASTYSIMPGAPCEVRLAGTTVISGYVDDVSLEQDAQRHAVGVTGRDKAADLVDCSAVVKGGQWLGQRVEAIAAQLAKPFGITVSTAVDTGKPLTSFALQEGETVFDAIDRAARMRALLLVSDAKGGLVITRASTDTVATPLVMGVNVLQATVKMSLRDRFSLYIAKGQKSPAMAFQERTGTGSPGASASVVAAAAKAAVQMRAESKDPEVPRYRPMIITGECQDVAASLQQRVQWEANVRAARSVEVVVRVAGWAHADGLWEPNKLVTVSLPSLRIARGKLLIKACQYSLGADGSNTELTMTRPDAFTLLPLKPQGAGGLHWTPPANPERAGQ